VLKGRAAETEYLVVTFADSRSIVVVGEVGRHINHVGTNETLPDRRA
jgi:hypothetical protein